MFRLLLILLIIQNIMSKKRFTKLEMNNYDYNSEAVVNQVLQAIVRTSADRCQDQQLKKISKKLLGQQFMYKEMNTVGQAYITDPVDGDLPQDFGQNLLIKENNRPFSAKIQKRYMNRNPSSKNTQFRYSKRASSRSTQKYSICQSAKSKQTKKYGCFRPNYDKFYPLQPESSNDDSFQNSFINSLREKKLAEQAYQRSKEQFLKAAAEQNEKYSKLNKRFLQAMGNKTYYYTKNGQTAQICQTSSRLLKKANTNRISNRTQPSKPISQVAKNETTVKYQQKQNQFKKTRQVFQIEEKPNILFYKSEHCKYQILN